MKQRIQKVLASAGVASRRHVEDMIRQGRVSVNGQVMIELPILIDPQQDRVAVDGDMMNLRSTARQSAPGPRYYILLNKPKGVYSTNLAQGEQIRAIDLLPRQFSARVYPVGRLDADSRGLLLLTNDGELTNQLTHPRYGVAKTYRAVVDGQLRPQDVQALERGLWLGNARTGQGLKTGRSHIRIIRRARDRSILEITIREGRNRQVRRMLARLGHKVRDLIRVRMGPLTLEGLKTGQSRPLTQREVDALRKLANSPVHAPRATAADQPRPAKDAVSRNRPRGRDDSDHRMR